MDSGQQDGSGGPGDAEGPIGSGDALVAAFARWAAGERAVGAASDRARQRWMADQVAATATWAGILVDLAEQMAAVTLSLAGTDQRLGGRVVGVGRDFCVLEQADGRPVLVVLSAVAVIRPGDGYTRRGMVPAGDRVPALDLSLTDALSALAEDRSRVLLCAGLHPTEGDLIGVAEDVIVLRTPPPSRRQLYVRLAAISWCEIR